MITKHQNAVKITEKQLLQLDLSEWIIEEKFKGIRVFFNKTPTGVSLITRGGQDITENFPHLTKIDWFCDIEQIQLDCELFDPNQEDETVSGWAMREVIDPQVVESCVLKVFDVLHLEQDSLETFTQIDRKRILGNLFLRSPFETVEYFEAKEHRAFFDYIIAKKGEGIMLKKKSAFYVPGARRVGLWFKRKKRDAYDVVILGFTQAKPGKFAGLIGAIRVGQFVGGHLRYICDVSGMTDDVRRDMTEHPEKYIGQVATVYAADQDKNSLALIEPSFKHLRIDKRPEECTAFNLDTESLEEKMVEL